MPAIHKTHGYMFWMNTFLVLLLQKAMQEQSLEMCRNNVQPAQCHWTGDNVHFGSGKNGSGKMSNSLLMRAFENILRMPNLPFRIRTIRKPRYSVYGSAMLHSIMARKQFFIHPKCNRTIQSIQRWTMKKNQSARSRDE